MINTEYYTESMNCFLQPLDQLGQAVSEEYLSAVIQEASSHRLFEAEIFLSMKHVDIKEFLCIRILLDWLSVFTVKPAWWTLLAIPSLSSSQMGWVC